MCGFIYLAKIRGLEIFGKYDVDEHCELIIRPLKRNDGEMLREIWEFVKNYLKKSFFTLSHKDVKRINHTRLC
jgi:hypothetical protein